jgi:hypothetical protein
MRKMNLSGQNQQSFPISRLNTDELYPSKLIEMLNCHHPRDFFDLMLLGGIYQSLPVGIEKPTSFGILFNISERAVK